MTSIRNGTERSSTGRARNRRGEGILLRQEIVDAAARLLQGQGPEAAVTLRAVAREAGIAAPSIYAHFPDPDAIVGVLIAETFDALSAALRASREGIDDPVLRLMAQCRAYLRFAAEQPGLYRVLFGRARDADRRDGATPSGVEAGRGGVTPSGVEVEGAKAARDARIREASAPAFAILVEAIAACVAAGRSTSGDPFGDAVGLWSALHGYIALRASIPGFPWPDEGSVLAAMVTGQARLVAVSE